MEHLSGTVSATLHPGGVFAIVLDRPPVNALREEEYRALAAALAVGVIAGAACILIGARGRVFCAGGELGGRLSEGVDAPETAGPIALLAAMRACPLPIVTRVQGVAAGAGMMVALLGDVIVGATGASLLLPEIDTGAIGGVRGAADVLPPGLARFMGLTGTRMPLEALAAAGVVARVVAPAELDAQAHGIAAAIAARGKAGLLPPASVWRRADKEARPLARL